MAGELTPCRGVDMTARDTCADCPHLKIEWMVGIALPGCGKTSPMLVVPHHMVNAGGGEVKSTFWRVPEFCPLPENEVTKRVEKAPQDKWVKKTFTAS
jgi:hypothetical protein